MTPTITPLALDDAAAKLHQPGSTRETLRLHAQQVANQHATYCAAEAAGALRLLFGEAAHRAVFERTTDSVDGVDANLLLVYDADDNVIWYSREFLSGCEIVAARDGADEPMPDLDADTLTYIEGLVEWAEEAHHEGYLPDEALVINPSGGKYASTYEGFTVHLFIDAELSSYVQAVGEPTQDGAKAREVAVLALQRVLDNEGHMFRLPLDDDERRLLAVITSLDPHDRPGS